MIEYNTLQLFTACGGIYSNSSGILTSPSYPKPYQHMADCVYLISWPNGEFVNVSFLTMDIDCQDYIEMRDGNTENSPLMGRVCGGRSNIPDFIITTQNKLRLR